MPDGWSCQGTQRHNLCITYTQLFTYMNMHRVHDINDWIRYGPITVGGSVGYTVLILKSSGSSRKCLSKADSKKQTSCKRVKLLLTLQIHLLSFCEHLITPAASCTAGVVVLISCLRKVKKKKFPSVHSKDQWHARWHINKQTGKKKHSAVPLLNYGQD